MKHNALVQGKTRLLVDVTAPNMEFEKAKDTWEALGNEILDYGDKSQPIIRAADVEYKHVAYIFYPEANPGKTVQDLEKALIKDGKETKGIRRVGDLDAVIVSERI